MRLQLKHMGLQHHGKMWQLTSRLEEAIWAGEGGEPDFMNAAPASGTSAGAAAGKRVMVRVAELNLKNVAEHSNLTTHGLSGP